MSSAEISPPTTPPSLAFSMRMFAEEALSPRTASAFRAVARVLEQGGSWADALASAGSRLPAFLRGVFVIAQRSGSVEQVVGDYLSGARRTRRAQRVVLGAVLYPAMLMLAIGLLMIGIFTLIIPPFGSIFEDFGVVLPFSTLTLIRVSRIIMPIWPWLLGALAASGALLLLPFMTLRLPLSATTVRVLQAIPVLGTASQLAGASDFCMLLSLLVRARIPLPDALRLTAGGLRDPNLRQGAHRLAIAVERGDTPAYAASVLPNFRPRIAALLRHTDNEKSFAELLRSHGELFALQAESHAGIAVMWMQPLLLLLVAVAGAAVVISLFFPLIKLLNELS